MFRKIKNYIKKIVGARSVRIPYAGRQNERWDPSQIYCPHPWTNWSLNPDYQNEQGILQHTPEGFRKTVSVDSLFSLRDRAKDHKLIYCIGGSTTYCTGVQDYAKTWPSLLQDTLNEGQYRGPVSIVNAGVGGWGTLQSLIRFISWAEVLKPDIVVLYQTKNDFTFVCNADPNEKNIWPDYANIMGQFGSVFSGNLKPLKRLRIDNLFLCYGRNADHNPNNLSRFDEDQFKNMIFRYRVFMDLSQAMASKVIVIPELMNGSHYLSYMNAFWREMNDLMEPGRDVFLLKMQSLIGLDESQFQDKCHLTEKGCLSFATVLGRFILQQDLLDKTVLPSQTSTREHASL